MRRSRGEVRAEKHDPAVATLLAGALLLLTACEREYRPFRELEIASASSQRPMVTTLYAGAEKPPTPEMSPFQENAYGIGEGKRLFTQLNCAGCHANGGGGMGPPLMDAEWIYGDHPANIFATIVEGRPNGMPSWRGKLTDAQVWQLVAYVQSMTGQAPLDALPGRADHMRATTPENARSAVPSVETGVTP
jgi:cytochrome c oxidase cbb3-type subunit 3